MTHWLLFTVAEEGGGQSLDDKPEMKRVEEGRQPAVEMVNLEQPVQNLTNTPQQQLPGDTPPPLSQPSPTTNKCKSSVVCVSCEPVFTATAVQYYLVN